MNNKEIGIFSLFNGQNFGNKLQNYAVQELLREYGLVPETFKYEIRMGAVNIRESLADKLKPSHTVLNGRISSERIPSTHVYFHFFSKSSSVFLTELKAADQ